MTQRQTLSLDDSSDPGLSLTHHKAWQCVTHTHTQRAFEKISKHLDTDHITVREKNHKFVCEKEKERYRHDSSDYCSHIVRFHNSAIAVYRGTLRAPEPVILMEI